MAKLLFVLLLSFAFLGYINCYYYVWNGNVTNGAWNSGSSWLNGSVPGSGDCVYLPAGVNVIVNSPVNIGNISLNSPSLIITNGGSLNVGNDMNFAANTVLRIDSGSSLNIGGRFVLSTAAMTFEFFGTATAGGLRVATAATITQSGPSALMITGTQTNIIDMAYSIDPNKIFFSAVTQTFVNINGPPGTLTFLSPITISTFVLVNNYQNPNPINLVLNGATFTTTSPIQTNNASSQIKPSITFNAALYILPSGTVIIDSLPTFSAVSNTNNAIVINGGTLSFTSNSDITFTAGSASSLNIMGTGGLAFTSNNQASGNQTANFVQTVNIFTPISFIQNANPGGNGSCWFWAGSPILNIYSSFSAQAIININNTLSTTFFAPLTIGPSVNSNPVGIRGSPTLTNGLINNGGIQILYSPVTLNCTGGNFQFSSVGSNDLRLQKGFTVLGCAVSAASGTTVSVASPIQVSANSSIDVSTVPLNTTSSYPTFTFNGTTSPQKSFVSLTFINNPTFQVNQTIYANNINIIITSAINYPNYPNGLIFSTQSNGQFDFPSSVSIGDAWTIGATVAFPSGAVTINKQSGSAPIVGFASTWSAPMLLRATTLSGNALINYAASSISVLNGISSISNPTFLLYSSLTVNYLPSGASNPGFENPTLVFASGQSRVWFNALTSTSKVAVIFDENLTFNNSLTFTANSPNGTITFRGANTINSVGSQSNIFAFSGSGIISFNQTNFRFTGPGTFNLIANIVVQGTINNPFQNTDGTVFVNSPTAYIVANSVFGPTVVIQNTGLKTDDGDGNLGSANTGLTLQGFTGIAQVLAGGSYSLGTNLTFTNNILFTGGITFTGQAGVITFSGNCMTIQQAVTFNMRVLFPGQISFNTSTTNLNPLVITFNANPSSPTNGDGVWFGGNVIVQTYTQVTIGTSPNYANVYFLTAATVSGGGVFNPAQGNLVATTGSVTLSTQTVMLSNTQYSGPGTFTLSPADNFLQVSAYQNPLYTTVTYSGSNVLLNGVANFTNNFLFSTSNVLNFTSNGAGISDVIFSGSLRTITTTWNFYNVSKVEFNTNLLLNTNTPFTGVNQNINVGQSQIYFYFDVLTANGVTATIPQNLTFGLPATTSSATLGTLILTGQSIIINGNLNFAGSSVVTTQYSGPFIQTINSANNAGVPGNWNFAQSTCFTGKLNFTSPAAFSIAHNLMAGGTLAFNQGLSLTAPATFTNSNGGTMNTIYIVGYLTISGNVFLGASNLITPSSAPFSFNGTGSNPTLTFGGVYTCSQNVFFSIAVTFTYIQNPNSGNSVSFLSGCSWYSVGTPIPINLFVTSFASAAPVGSVVYTPLYFSCFNGSSVTVGGANLFLYGNIFLNTTKTINFGGTNFGAITVTSTTNAVATGIKPVNLVTFSTSSSIPNAEPNISFSGELTQPIYLTSPTVLNGIAMGKSSSITSSSTGRADFVNSLTLSSTVYISQPYNFFVISNSTNFVLTCTSGGTGSVFTFAPTTSSSPFGYGNPSFTFSTDATSTIKFVANPSYTFNNVNIQGGGTLRFAGASSGASITAIGTVSATGGSTLWVDLVSLSANNVSIAGGSTPANVLKVSFSNTPSTAFVKSNFALYGGAGVVYLSNYNPNSTQALPFVQAPITTGQALTPVGGSPGYSYSTTRSGNCLFVNVNPNAKPSPAPTPSNGPGPVVSATVSFHVFSSVILLLSVFLALFAF